MPAWRNWYHCIGSTFGAWLRGDSRGWRARHHREHVEGDYRNPPPPGKYDKSHKHSKRLMKREPVVLSREQRKVALLAMLEALRHYDVEVIVLAVGGKHYHMLARFTPFGIPAAGVAGLCAAHHRKDGLDPVPRYVLGKVHSWCSRKVKQHKRQSPGTHVPGTGGLWAPRPKIIPIVNRAHQVDATNYIADHIDQGASIWVCNQ